MGEQHNFFVKDDQPPADPQMIGMTKAILSLRTAAWVCSVGFAFLVAIAIGAHVLAGINAANWFYGAAAGWAGGVASISYIIHRRWA